MNILVQELTPPFTFFSYKFEAYLYIVLAMEENPALEWGNDMVREWEQERSAYAAAHRAEKRDCEACETTAPRQGIIAFMDKDVDEFTQAVQRLVENNKKEQAEPVPTPRCTERVPGFMCADVKRFETEIEKAPFNNT